MKPMNLEHQLSEYGIFCEFSDGSKKEFNIFISREASEAQFLFEVLSQLQEGERHKLSSLGTLRISSSGEIPLAEDKSHWLRTSQLINLNRYQFVSGCGR